MEIASVTRLLHVGVFIAGLLCRFSTGSNSKLTFSVETARTPYLRGDILTLLCEAKNNDSYIEIRKMNGQIILNKTQGEKLLKYKMTSVTCADMGIYKCVVDHVYTETIDVALYDCNPCLCYDQEVIETIIVDINETVEFSFCVLVTYYLASLAINGSVVDKRSSPWSWYNTTINSSPGESNRFNITVKRHQMSVENFGLLKIRVLGSKGEAHFLDYNIYLQPRGDPSQDDESPAVSQPLSVSGFNLLHGLVLTVVVFSVLVPIITFAFWRLKVKQKKDTRHRHSGHVGKRRHRRPRRVVETVRGGQDQPCDVRPHNHQQLNTGEYISEEGLKYVTLAEIQKKCRREKFKGSNNSHDDKTEYAVLDFSRTGKMMLKGTQP